MALINELTDKFEVLYTEANLTPQDHFKFITNEIRSALNRHKLTFKNGAIPPQLATMLLVLRKVGKINNKQIKVMLDEQIEYWKSFINKG